VDEPREPKGTTARRFFDALCDILDVNGGDSGAKLKRAVNTVGEVVGEEGAKCLKDGDVVGAALEATRNARKRKE
jgi:hypothetical protein